MADKEINTGKVNQTASQKPFNKAMALIVGISAIAVVVISGLILLLMSANNKVSTGEKQIADLQSRLGSAQTQLSESNSRISENEKMIANLRTELTGSQNEVISMQKENAGLKSQLAIAESAIASSNSQVVNLQNIVTLAEKQVMVNSKTVNSVAGTQISVVSFWAEYAGYISVQGTSNTSNGYVRVLHYYGTATFDYTKTIGTSGTGYFSVLPGVINVYFGNTNAGTPASATLSVMYYY